MASEVASSVHFTPRGPLALGAAALQLPELKRTAAQQWFLQAIQEHTPEVLNDLYEKVLSNINPDDTSLDLEREWAKRFRLTDENSSIPPWLLFCLSWTLPLWTTLDKLGVPNWRDRGLSWASDSNGLPLVGLLIDDQVLHHLLKLDQALLESLIDVEKGIPKVPDGALFLSSSGDSIALWGLDELYNFNVNSFPSVREIKVPDFRYDPSVPKAQAIGKFLHETRQSLHKQLATIDLSLQADLGLAKRRKKYAWHHFVALALHQVRPDWGYSDIQKYLEFPADSPEALSTLAQQISRTRRLVGLPSYPGRPRKTR